MNTYNWVTIISWVQATILLVFYVNFIIWFVKKNEREKKAEKILSKCSSLITKRLMKFLDGKSDFRVFQFKKNTRLVFKAQLLEHISGLSGQEKEFLVEWYRQWEFIEMDFEDLTSKKWWKRLRGMVNLDLLSDEKILFAVWPIIDDPNKLLAYSAMKTIARIGTKMHYKSLIQKMENMNIVQTDLLIEVFSNISKKHPELLVTQLADIRNVKIKIAIIQVLGELNNIESIPVIITILKESNENEIELKVTCIRSIAKLEDPATIGDIEHYLTSPNPLLRAEAISALSKLDESSSAKLLQNFADDSASEVVSVLRYLKLVSLRRAS